MTKTTTTSSNPFEFATIANDKSAESRKLDFTPVLITTSTSRAQDLMLLVSKKPELHALANKAIDGGEPQDLIDLIKAVYDDEAIKTDARILEGCDDNQLSRLLESRRSDRSKSKAKGPRSSAQVCRTYIACMYAELIIRDYWKKPYTGQQGSTVIDYATLGTDQDAISRKVKSLQSKKSRLVKLAEYDVAAANELAEVQAEIAHLNTLRPSVRTVTKTVVKDLSVDGLRALLKDFDVGALEPDKQAEMLDLIKKLG